MITDGEYVIAGQDYAPQTIPFQEGEEQLHH